MPLLAFLKSLIGIRRWPAGEPLLADGTRWGTRLASGAIVGAPGFEFTPLPVCSRCQQAIDADGEQHDFRSMPERNVNSSESAI